jgi:glyoxylase-like metal-dependent hydrolase (beta-lactamase superfamily II)/rhodanese-related sulfurtransferase
MKIEQIYTGCLAQGAYYVVSDNEAFIIDPLREVQPYMDRIAADGVKLKYIFETHFHADFVSGHLDLSQQTGAPIVYGPTSKTEFEAIIATDGQIFEIGSVKIKVLHTPGHTMESTTFLLINEEGKDEAIFSGDTLFLGDVGRPDLAQKAADMTQDQLAGMLYDSLMTQIMPLADDVTVYPAHGAGSACGKNMMKETVDTLGNQKKMNVAMNKKGYESFEDVKAKALTALSADAFETLVEATGALILDTRPAAEFHKGFVPQAINIGIRGDFAPWVGALIGDVKQEIVLIIEPGMEEEVVTRLSRVGFDKVLGYLEGGFATWQEAGKEIDQVKRITADEFAAAFKAGESMVIDVRKESEYEAEHVEDAYSKPLAYINDWTKDIQPEQHFFMHCAGGYRSMIAASILQARGYRNFTEVDGGFGAISKTAVPTTDFVCQSKVMKS